MSRSIKEIFGEIARWNDVEHELLKRGIKGQKGCDTRCPMAVYIIGQTSPAEVTEVAVDTYTTTYRTPYMTELDADFVIDNPENMSDFIIDFDEGDIPSLDLFPDQGVFDDDGFLYDPFADSTARDE